MSNVFIILLSAYALLTFLVALMALGRRMQYSSALAICFFMTPVLGLVAILQSDRTIRTSHYTTRYQCKRCNYEFTENAAYCSLCDEEGEQSELEPIRKMLIN